MSGSNTDKDLSSDIKGSLSDNLINSDVEDGKEGREMPRWLRYLPNYQQVVHNEPPKLPPVTSKNSNDPLNALSIAHRRAGVMNESPDSKGALLSPTPIMPIIPQGTGRKRQRSPSIKNLSEFLSSNQIVEEAVGVVEMPRLWEKDDNQDNDNQEVRVKYTKKQRVGEGSITEIAALMSFSKC